jgi:DNA topoisomerase-1
VELIITEKQIAAKRIAQILSDGKMKQRKAGEVAAYEFDGKAVIGLSGHIIGIDFPKEYARWNYDFHKLIGANTVKVPVQEKYTTALKNIAKEASRVVIATDYDREGELIGVEALDIVRSVNPNVAIFRVRYSAITPEEIKKAFASPVDVDYNLASSCEARQEIDLIWGAALTRFVSLASGRLGGDFLSVGRVQSPTLALLVEKEKEIESFVTKKYWEVQAVFPDFVAKHDKGRFWDEAEAKGIVSRLGKEAVVTDMKKEERGDHPPSPFNTTEFLRAATAIGFSAANAMRIAEWLYMNGYISYPRTDNTVFPELDFRSLIGMFLQTEFSPYASELLKKDRLVPVKGKKLATDHPPIYPAAVGVDPKGSMTNEQYKVYELIVRRFFANFADPSIWERKKVELKIDGEPFSASGIRIVKEGWRWFYPYNRIETKLLPELSAGQKLKAVKVEAVGKETKPPPRYTQGVLIKKMEDLGLGTKSTRHETLSKLYERSYVQGKQIRPTKKAYAVIDSLASYAASITKPDMTRLLEEDMDRIAAGKKTEKEVVDESRTMLDSIFKDLMKDKAAISQVLKDKMREDEQVGACPKCNADLLIKRSRRGLRFIGCSAYPKCDFSLPLPRDGRVTVLSQKCEKHGLPFLQINKSGRKPWTLGCPYCNFIEWKENSKKEKSVQTTEAPVST